MQHSATATLLFTDLVNSTELLSRAGDERAQQIFRAHRKLLSDAVATHGGHEVKWLGDGLMVAFPSAAGAVRCAIAMQQRARRPVAGVRLNIRAGLHAGEALKEESDYFGTTVVTAKRLCDRALAGQIICSSLVAGLLAGRRGFDFRDLGALELKGFATPVTACEVIYEHDDPTVLLRQMPFVGRVGQMARLERKLADARGERGGLVMLVGEPGIGKTRTLEEFAANARAHGTLVLWGRCYEGEWAPPYGPFAEALTEYARGADTDVLRREIGYGGPPLSRLVPAIRERLPDVDEPAPLQPEEERFRVLDAVSQLLIAASARAVLVLVLDDLHWADRGTIAMLRHVSRFIARNRILVIGAYRDVEIDRQHPLSDALSALRREAEYERIDLRGLDDREVGELLETIADQEVPNALVEAIEAETDGNPFFIREVLLHLIEEGKITRQDGRWTANLAIEELGVTEGVRQVIQRRLSRLSEAANRFLAVASAFNGAFQFAVAAKAAGLDEDAALKALDAALDAQLIRPGAEADRYDFTHALTRHTLYREMSPSRQVRTHRQIAEAMETVWDARTAEHAAEIAYQYSRSAALPGAERGADYAIAAADRAEAAYAHDEVVALVRIALDLLPALDARRPRLLGRLGLALIWTPNSDDALRTSREAGEQIANSEGDEAAAEYLLKAVDGMDFAGHVRPAWELAKDGLRYSKNRRDLAWAEFTAMDIGREEAEDPNNPGIPIDSPRRRELAEVIKTLSEGAVKGAGLDPRFAARGELVRDPEVRGEVVGFRAGDYRRSVLLIQEAAAESEKKGRIAWAMMQWATVARGHNAMGEFAAASSALNHAIALSRRLTARSIHGMNLVAAGHEMRLALDDRWEEALARASEFIRRPAPEDQWAFSAVRASVAYIFARTHHVEEALECLSSVREALDRGVVSTQLYTALACDAASTLWLLNRTDFIETIVCCLRDKVIAPDFRWPMRDARLSMAQLCALQGRYDAAVEWFAKARGVLDEQGARPLRAITDFDEAWMYLRRGAAGDRERAKPLLDAAIYQFRDIGMTGWLRRAEALVSAAN